MNNNIVKDEKLKFIFQNYRKPFIETTLHNKKNIINGDGSGGLWTSRNEWKNEKQGMVESGAPPSGWIDYITKLPLAKLERVQS